MKPIKIQATKNYRLFKRHDGENRPFDLAKRSLLKESMRTYGFLKCYPIVCFRDPNGSLIVKDGQHRLGLAEELGLTVYWVPEETDFDVAVANAGAKGWTIKDYALKHAANGIKAYQEVLEFAERFKMAVSQAASLLGGTPSFTHLKRGFLSGTYKVKDRKWAEVVAGLYSQMVSISPAVRDQRFLEACAAVGRVEDFDGGRLVHGAQRCREILVKYGTRDGYLTMIEDVYNFGRSKRYAVKIPALNAMRARNPGAKGVGKNGKPEKPEDPTTPAGSE